MKGVNEQEVEKFIGRRLASGRLREQILTRLCEVFGVDWEEAEALLFDYEIRRGAILSSYQILLMAMAGFVLSGGLLLGAYILAALLIGDNANGTTAVLVFFFGAFLFLTVLSIHSWYENSNKELYRCPNCSTLTNRLGHQNPVFLPLYERSTYLTHKKLLDTQKFGEYTGPAGWQIYRKFEVSQICRHCHHVRSNKLVVKKVVSQTHSQRDNY